MASPRGEFELRIYGRGRLLLAEREPNVIVNGAAEVLARLLAGTAGPYAVGKIGFGISGVEASAADTALTGAFVKAIGSYTFPETGKVRFAWTLGAGEANGKQIREFGLLTAGNALVARKVRQSGAVIEKTTDVSLSGSWSLMF